MQLAVALYPNSVDDEDELEFRRGDILTVLIENPHGLDGWWLCQHRDKCGLCPANRLKLISPQSDVRRSHGHFPSHLYDKASDLFVTDGNEDHDYDNARCSGKRVKRENAISIAGIREDFMMKTARHDVANVASEWSSSRSSGISSTMDMHQSSSSNDVICSGKFDVILTNKQQHDCSF
jgi:hypothetical protein